MIEHSNKLILDFHAYLRLLAIYLCCNYDRKKENINENFLKGLCSIAKEVVENLIFRHLKSGTACIPESFKPILYRVKSLVYSGLFRVLQSIPAYTELVNLILAPPFCDKVSNELIREINTNFSHYICAHAQGKHMKEYLEIVSLFLLSNTTTLVVCCDIANEINYKLVDFCKILRFIGETACKAGIKCLEISGHCLCTRISNELSTLDELCVRLCGCYDVLS